MTSSFTGSNQQRTDKMVNTMVKRSALLPHLTPAPLKHSTRQALSATSTEHVRLSFPHSLAARLCFNHD